MLLLAVSWNVRADVQCQNSGAAGANVDADSRCGMILHYKTDNTPLDQRLVDHLHVPSGSSVRSIAVIAAPGVSTANALFNLPVADRDFDSLVSFFTNDQQFDEVIGLRDRDVTIDNLRYFLRTYALKRGLRYNGMVRFVFAFSGHGVQIPSQGGAINPTTGLVMADATDDQDYDHLLGLNELRALGEDLSKHTFHLLFLLNACFGGDLFGVSVGGTDASATDNRGSWAVTAGPPDKEVYPAKDGSGSLFFQSIINGVKSGDADNDAYRVTIGQVQQPKSLNGIVRLEALTAYLDKAMRMVMENDPSLNPDVVGNYHPQRAPLEALGLTATGGFFFFQPSKQVASAGLPKAIAFNLTLSQVLVGLAPSSNQVVNQHLDSMSTDGFDQLRQKNKGVIRGVDISHLDGQVNWATASHEVQFVYIKATQGAKMIDASLKANWDAAAAAGIPHGAYHFFSFCSTPEEQAQLISKNVPVDANALPFGLDVEVYPGLGAGIPRDTACAQALGKEGIKERVTTMVMLLRSVFGKTPVVYANEYLLTSVMPPDFSSKVPLWRVRIGVAGGAPQGAWSIWQYSNNTTVAGFPNPVDVNVLSTPPKPN
jgi:GH25 family lysozyme M1 (1,4-beta-N-acetylmuramidase)